MPYYKIDRNLIFLHKKNYYLLDDLALNQKDDVWRQEREENKEADKLKYNKLQEIYKTSNPDDFYREWVYFELLEKDAKEDLPYLLYDYCTLNKNVTFRELRDEDAVPFLPDLAQKNIDSRYEVTVFSQSLFKKKKLFSFIIDTRKLMLIAGELSKFGVAMQDYTIYFGKEVVILDNDVTIENTKEGI
ncbi:hypothetical protein [Ectobacillus panaciterrae]|uniref:hypothetical protein n=1 Tax=Ectobacillus panaciterrae TaxID=363872 RepID=UPI0003FB6A0D|nr:hypothetical protein [Ectobacillus panaciterrae]